MSLSPGSKLGSYEIISLLGAGGMGEVYRARDPRLGRDVAIKVLPAERMADEGRRRRFAQEARAASALNHPNIVTIHEIESADGNDFIVMEYVPGQTLDALIPKSGMRLGEVVRTAISIADALAAAHSRGIVHRDLKPANVVVSSEGVVKVLDFGLAKLVAADTSDDGETMTAAGGSGSRSHPGTITGTAGYMSPEQATGGKVDARSDVFCFGAVLYEMVTGRRAFAAGSTAETLSAVVREQPKAASELVAGLPKQLEKLIVRCLMKEPDRRSQHMSDVAVELQEIKDDLGSRPAAVAVAPARRRRWVGAGLAALVALTLGSVGGWVLLRPSARRSGTGRAPATEAGGQVARSYIDLLSGTRLTRNGFSRPEVALSPDGSLLVWSGSADGTEKLSALYRRPLDSDEATAIPGTDEGQQPFFSPDGRWIGFSAKGKLRKVPVGGGLAVDLADVEPPMGASWAADGRILLGSRDHGLDWIPAEGGAIRALTTVDPAREVGHRLPWMLPGGSALLFTAVPHSFGVRARVEALSLPSGARKVLVEDGADARYLPSGHIVFMRQGVLMAATFDAVRLELTGAVVPVVPGVRQALNTGPTRWNSGAAQFAISPYGLLAYASGGILEDPPLEPVLVDRAGRAEPLPGFDKPLVCQFRFSPDGRQIAFVERARSGLLWLFDLERQTHRALSREGIVGFPRWSPDGKRLVVGWSAAGPLNLWSLPVEGDGAWERLTESAQDWPSSWSPDGRLLAFVRSGQTGDIFLCRFEDRQVLPFVATKAEESYPEFSPDGRWLAYVSDETGRREVYVTSFPDRKKTLVVSGQGGIEPTWSRDGETLFYRSSDSHYMGVPVILGASLSLGQPRVLFDSRPYWMYGPVRGPDLHPDGRRFLFVRLKGQPPPNPPITRLNLVQNWFAALDRVSPTRP